jgi:hypothetical protein
MAPQQNPSTYCHKDKFRIAVIRENTRSMLHCKMYELDGTAKFTTKSSAFTPIPADTIFLHSQVKSPKRLV